MAIETLSVAIQGQEGSYHDQAAGHYFGEAYDPRFLETFADVFEAVSDGRVNYGMSAVENSLVGSIAPVYDLLRATGGVSIMGEVFLGIHHSLIGMPGARIEDIRDVHSHPVALAQCTDFLKRELPHAVAHNAADTAGSASYVRERGDLTTAAIAGANNAERNGLQVLREGVENNPENYTRFLVLGKTENDSPERRSQADKTSLLVERLTDDADELAPGTLHTALGCFAVARVGLTKIESRPVQGRPWRYNFYLDCAAGAENPKMQLAMRALDSVGAVWRELGTYKSGETI
ncbi:MAG TPA: prephenate dehydratase domain-containing protein [Patescibacteria group bacterium]|nr:prephenate dehydratase domain-containing protein [Patescibacteria group bacterium]